MARRSNKSDLPFEKIKIGYIEAKVNGVEGRDADKREIFGEFFSKQHEIDYDVSMVGAEKVNTILHEILHGITHVFGIRFNGHDQEEEIVNAMAGGLTTLFRDNPKFVDWMRDVLHNEEE